MFFTVPTILTWTRIVAIPLIVGVFYLGLPHGVQNLVATVMFVAFALTDWLDGWLARRLNQTSAFPFSENSPFDLNVGCTTTASKVPAGTVIRSRRSTRMRTGLRSGLK